MQDIHAIGGVGGRLFGGGDRRLRPQHQNQSLKCPRCDSLNTKFCYYNNYNLSQPRHFCKSCRRYWTKGGVLRNVPVGGGCRKTKRSKPKQSPETPRERKSNSNSSSESSSLTATTPMTATATATATTAVASGVTTDTGSASFNFPESRFFVPPPQSTNPNFEHNASSEGGVFPEIGSFTSLMTATGTTNDPTVINFSGSDISPFRLNHHEQQLRQNQQQWQLPKMTSTATTNMNDEMTAGFLDQTVHVDLQLQNRSSNGGGGGGFAALDWQGGGGGDQGLFEFTGTVDQGYWNQNQWSSDHDHTLYLP